MCQLCVVPTTQSLLQAPLDESKIVGKERYCALSNITDKHVLYHLRMSSSQSN